MRYTALLVALAGMVCLHLMAMYRAVPTITVSQITPAMNYAFKSVIGRAQQPLRMYEEKGKVTGCMLMVADETGELRIRGFKQVAEDLRQHGITVRKGDRVKVAGTLRVIEDNISMNLQSADQLEVLESPQPSQIAFEELGGIEEGRAVTVCGTLERIDMPRSERAPYTIRMEDGTGAGQLVLWRDVFQSIANEDQLQRGATLEVRATVSQHRGVPQLQVDSAQDVRIIAAATHTDAPGVAGADTTPARTVTLSDIGSDQIGRSVQIEASIASVRAPASGSRAPYTITLDDTAQQMPLVVWATTYAQLAQPEKLVAGTRVAVTATVNEFRGALQLELKRASDLKILDNESATATPTPASKAVVARAHDGGDAPLTPAAAVALDAGARVLITGVVVNVRMAREGTRAPNTIYLRGADGDVPLVCWQDVFMRIAEDQRPGPNAVIKARVTVDRYRETKQLKLLHADDYELMAKGLITTPTEPEATRLAPSGSADMSLSDALRAPVNKTVRFTARVKTVVVSPDANTPYRIVLEDGGKEFTVVAWPLVWAQMAPDERPKEGAQVRVEGAINVYRNSKQIRIGSPSQLRVVK
jgi:DNA/RNA endonuclease YhcR with UshA esterase domain